MKEKELRFEREEEEQELIESVLLLVFHCHILPIYFGLGLKEDEEEDYSW
jgi:hypothetical protein